jgi:multisubunit Na+/H+ antiporter MnhB subunit
MDTVTINGINLVETATNHVYNNYIGCVVVFSFTLAIFISVVVYGKVKNKNLKTNSDFEIAFILSAALAGMIGLLFTIMSYQYFTDYDYLVLEALHNISTEYLIDYTDE